MENKSGCDIRYQAATLGLLALVVAATFGLSAQPGMQSAESIEQKTIQRSDSSRTPEMVIRQWPARARGIAGLMIDKYGQPDRLSADALIWYNNGPWQKTVAYRKAWPHYLAQRDKDYLEQSIYYQVPSDKINALKRFDPRIEVDKSKDAISCRSESESINFLVLNLADEIIANKRSVDGARRFYRDAQRLALSGKTSPYMEGFLFEMINDIRSDPEYPGHL